jgi:hypothetical protein
MQQLDSSQRQLQRYLDLIEVHCQMRERSAEVRRGRSQALMSLAQVAQGAQRLCVKADALLLRVDNPGGRAAGAGAARPVCWHSRARLEDALALIQSQTELSEADARLKRMAEVALAARA